MCNCLKRLFEKFWMGSNNVHNVRFGLKVFITRPVLRHLVWVWPAQLIATVENSSKKKLRLVPFWQTFRQSKETERQDIMLQYRIFLSTAGGRHCFQRRIIQTCIIYHVGRPNCKANTVVIAFKLIIILVIFVMFFKWQKNKLQLTLLQDLCSVQDAVLSCEAPKQNWVLGWYCN